MHWNQSAWDSVQVLNLLTSDRQLLKQALSTQKRRPPAVVSEISLAVLLKMRAAFLFLSELSGRLKKCSSWTGETDSTIL